MGRPCPVTPEQKTEITRLYVEEQISRNELARMFNASRFFIGDHLRQCGIEIRENSKASRMRNSLAVNHNAFQEPLSDEAAYWVGFLMADGCISAQKWSPYVILALSTTDLGHVEAFKTFLKAEHRIGIRKGSVRTMKDGAKVNGGSMADLRISSAQMASDLARYGVVPKKTHQAQLRELCDNHHTWRGLIDGDGSLHIQARKKRNGHSGFHKPRPILQVIGTLALMEQFADYAARTVGYTGRPHRDHNSWCVSMSCGLCIRMVRQLYTPGCISLLRKAAIAAQMIEQFTDTSPLLFSDPS